MARKKSPTTVDSRLDAAHEKSERVLDFISSVQNDLRESTEALEAASAEALAEAERLTQRAEEAAATRDTNARVLRNVESLLR